MTRVMFSPCPADNVSFGSRHQIPRAALAPQDFVDAGDAAGEGVRRVEDGGVRVGERRAAAQQCRVY